MKVNYFDYIRLNFPAMPLELVEKAVKCPVLKSKLPLKVKVYRAVYATIRHNLTCYDSYISDEKYNDRDMCEEDIKDLRRSIRPFIEKTIDFYKTKFTKADIPNILYSANLKNLWGYLTYENKKDIIFSFSRKYNNQYPFLSDELRGKMSWVDFLSYYKTPNSEFTTFCQMEYLLKLILEVLTLRYFKINSFNKVNVYNVFGFSDMNPYMDYKRIKNRI